MPRLPSMHAVLQGQLQRCRLQKKAQLAESSHKEAPASADRGVECCCWQFSGVFGLQWRRAAACFAA